MLAWHCAHSTPLTVPACRLPQVAMLPELPQLRLVLQQQVQLLGAPAAALIRELRAATERHGSTRDVFAVAAQAQEL
jgi:hypothetical protein